MRTAALLLGLLAAHGPAAVSAAAQVEQFVPQGTARQVRQASARFSSPMVALGDPRVAAPFDVTCPAPGAGRWIDPRTWVYDFGKELPAGIVCTFTPRQGLTALDGTAVVAQPFVFSTGGPAIVRAIPGDGGEIDEDQVLVLQLDGPVDDASIAAHAWFTVQDLPGAHPDRRAGRCRARSDPAHARRLAAAGAPDRGGGAAPVSERRARLAGVGCRHPRTGRRRDGLSADAALDDASRVHRGAVLRARECHAGLHPFPPDAGAILGAGLA